MTRNHYSKLMTFFKNHKEILKLLELLYKLLPLLIFAGYPLVLLVYALNNGFLNITFAKIFFVPLCTFVLVTVFRFIFNFQRPYEKYNIKSAISKDTQGKSFPSRHVASAFIIGMTFLYLNTTLGIVFLVLGSLIACTRVLAGVHFIRDVVASAIFSIFVGCIFYF